MKIGLIKFLNSLPLKLLLEYKCNVIEGTPAEINSMFADGKLDAGMVSSVEYLKNKNKYELGDICIASQTENGEVGSVLLFAKKPLDEIKKLALPKDSVTSNTLVRVFVEADEIAFHNYEKSVDEFLDDFDAVLFIGDNALFAQSGYQKYDLAKLWFEKTGLPMVFGVMVGQKLREKFHMDINEVTNLASEKSGVEKAILQDYFENKLHFVLGEKERESLEELAKYLTK